MSKALRVLNPDGSVLVELDARDTRELEAKAHAAGLSPQEWLRQRLLAEWTTIMRQN